MHWVEFHTNPNYSCILKKKRSITGRKIHEFIVDKMTDEQTNPEDRKKLPSMLLYESTLDLKKFDIEASEKR